MASMSPWGSRRKSTIVKWGARARFSCLVGAERGRTAWARSLASPAQGPSSPSAAPLAEKAERAGAQRAGDPFDHGRELRVRHVQQTVHREHRVEWGREDQGLHVHLHRGETLGATVLDHDRRQVGRRDVEALLRAASGRARRCRPRSTECGPRPPAGAPGGASARPLSMGPRRRARARRPRRHRRPRAPAGGPRRSQSSAVTSFRCGGRRR